MDSYPNIHEVCELFDVTVLHDIREAEGEEHQAPCPRVDADGGECTCKPIQCYAIGWSQELSAGIRGGSMSPYFDSLDELETFCAKRIETCREIAKDEEGKLPDLSALEEK